MISSKSLQIILVIFGLLLITLSVFYYQNKQTTKILEKQTEEEIKSLDAEKENIFENITYTGIDLRGNPYEINAKYSETNLDQPDINNLKFVTAKLTFKDNQTIIITSDNAIYNKTSKDMFFSENVIVTSDINRIICNNLDFHNLKNLIVAYKDLTAYNGENIMIADKIEIDLITKKSKVTVDEAEKVKVKIIN